MKPIMLTLNINQNAYEIDAEPDTPLLWVIRDIVGLTGTKFGCGKGLCGACTIHLDGIAVRSCITPLSSAIDRPITTIEGLGGEDDPHPLQEAWLEHNVPQCGYCQPGQLMQASSLLDQNSSPTEAEIKTAMAGNLCRCGTYPRILKAIKQVAADSSPLFQDATEPKSSKT
jgi:isoquinoline 1-oxidoreductase alpha subunit